jgi:hypothetical protein
LHNAPFCGVAGGGGYNTFNLLTNLSFGSGCRCCYDPNGDGGEYELLASTKRERTAAGVVHADEAEIGAIVNDFDCSSNDDNDSDGEFDYLLDCDIPNATNNNNTDESGDDGYNENYDDLQSQRRADLLAMAYHHEVARYHGYGVHRQMHPQRIFASAGYDASETERDKISPPGSVLHLYDAYSSLSVSLDICLESMAKRFGGTKFVRGLGITSLLYAKDGGDNGWKKGNLPMLFAIKNGRIIAYSSGLRDFYRDGRSSTPEVEDALVEQWLDRAGVLHTHPPPLVSLCRIRPEEDMLLENMRKLNGLGSSGGRMMRQSGRGDVDAEEEEKERYDCGMVGCNKSFYHEHVGVKNDTQAGVLVSESQVVSSPD